MTSYFTKVLAKMYRLFMNANEKVCEENRVLQLDRICQRDLSSNIGKDADIQNATGNKGNITIGSNTWIRGHLLVYNHGGNIEIGNDSFVGPGCKIWSAKQIKIGNRVLISHNVNIHDNISHPLNSMDRRKDFLHILKSGSLQSELDLAEKEICIGDDVWIGFNATILKGVTIGKGAIIGACALITKDVPPYAVVINESSQKIIKFVS